MALYRRSPYSAAPNGAKTRDEERHTRNENRAGNQKSWGPAYRQELAERSGAKAYMLRISSPKLHISTNVVPRTPGGQRPQDNSQSQTAKPESKGKNKTKTGKESGNMREEASIPPDSIQDKIKHLFYLQGVSEPQQAILSEVVLNHLERF